MERRKPSPPHLLIFFNLLLLNGSLATGTALQKIDVGVVLDTTSWIGNISWTCIELAVDDFYRENPDYTTRLALHLRESGGDAFGAASAALDLLENVHVQAIIGPQKSTQAKFVIELGRKTQVPIVSFSAKNPSLSSIQNLYFIRTALNDSVQAEVIASIVKKFKWMEVVPVFEDSDYGALIVPYLVDAFQESGARVPYRSTIPLSATNQQIREELNKLNNMQTRVFVVHMSYSLGLQLFQIAKDMGMLGEGYVWITTYGLTDLVDLVGSSATNVMQGVLGIKPYVKETDKLNALKKRWITKFNQRNHVSKVSEPTVFGLWAYDTVWSLALAAEKVRATNSTFLEKKIANSSTVLATLGISQNGLAFRNMIRSTHFDGMSGKFHLIDGQLEPQAFEIINIVGNKMRRIGFWTPTYGTSRYIESKVDLESVKWPGNPTKVPPRGWEWPTRGKKLKIGVPVKPGFGKFVNLTKDPVTHHKGFCIEVFEDVMNALPYRVEYNYSLFENATKQPNGTYDDLIYQVFLQNYDAVVGDVTILANRSLYVDFTLPFTESGVSMVVPVMDQPNKGAWTFTEPLTLDLWLASSAFIVFTGIVVWVLEHRINDEFRGTPRQQLGTVFYFSFSTLVFAHREVVVSNLSRVVIIIWFFVVLILIQSYTATLSSILTVQQLQPTVSHLDDIIRTGGSVGYLENSFIPALLKGLNFKNSKLIPLSSTKQFHEALSNGSVAAIVEEIPYLRLFLSQYCNKYTMVGPTYKSDGFGFVFPRGSPLVPDVSRKILEVIEKNLTALENILYGNNTCLDIGDVTSTSSSLSFKSFWGLFLITGVTSVWAVLLHLTFFLYKHRDILRSQDVSENTVQQKLALLAKLYNQSDNSQTNKEIEKDEPVTEDLMASTEMASPDVLSVMPSPSVMSSYTNSNFGPEDETGSPLSVMPSPSVMSSYKNSNFEPEDGTGSPPSGEGTPGREISAQDLDPPSFADMVRLRIG